MKITHTMVRNTIAQYSLASPKDQDEIATWAWEITHKLINELGPIATYHKLIDELVPEIEDETNWGEESLKSYNKIRDYMIAQTGYNS